MAESTIDYCTGYPFARNYFSGERMSLLNPSPKSEFVEGRECPVCLKQIEYEEDFRALSCDKNHIYHFDCLVKNMALKDMNCAYCKEPITIQ